MILTAQEVQEEDQKGFQKEKLFFGGNFGLTFGNYTLINVSPQIGYRFTERLAAGMGVNMQYVSFKERDFRTNNVLYKTSQGVAGLNVFGRAYPIRQFFVQLQPELNYIFGKQTYYQPREEFKMDAEIVPSVLAGGGMAIPGGRGAFLVSIFYDVLQHKNSPYGRKPVYSFGYNIGF
jgi:transcriptional regulator with XRE-family HTH domain